MNCEQLKSSVLRWMGQEISCRPNGDSLIATLPLLKPNGDAIEIGIEPLKDNRFRLSDLGDTHATLYLAGVDLLDEYVRGEEFRQVVAAHDIIDFEKELSVEASPELLAEHLFDFVHAIQSMLALQLTLKPQQERRNFAAIVAKFFAERGASFEIPDRIAGKTGKWKFNFVLNHVREETLIKTLTAANKGQAEKSVEQSIFEIRDVKEIKDTQAVVIADDEGYRKEYWGAPAYRMCNGYGIPLLAFEAGRQELSDLAEKYSIRGT